MTIPRLILAHLVLIQSYVLLAQLNIFFDPPSASGCLHHLLQGEGLRCKHQIVGQFIRVAETAAAEQPLLPSRREPTERAFDPNPVIPAGVLASFSSESILFRLSDSHMERRWKASRSAPVHKSILVNSQRALSSVKHAVVFACLSGEWSFLRKFIPILAT